MTPPGRPNAARLLAGLLAGLLAHTAALAPGSFAQDAPAPGASAPAAATDPELLLAGLEQALGGADALATLGDVELVGTLNVPGRRHRWRAFVRRQPFAVREELTTISADPDYDHVWNSFSPPLGSPPSVTISDGLTVWQLDADGGSGPLSSRGAIAALDNAHWLRLLLDPRGAARRVIAQPPGPMPDAPGLAPSARSGDLQRLGVEWHHGAFWLLYLDPESGRLCGLDAVARAPALGLRTEAWASLGPLTLPARRWEVAEGVPPSALNLTELNAGLSLPDELFAGDPRPPRARLADVASLLVTNTAVPGSAYLALTELRLQGRGPFTGLLDTGASRVVIDTAIAKAARLPVIGEQTSRGAFVTSVTPIFFADILDIGKESLLHLPVVTAELPSVLELPSANRVRVLLGGERLLELAPVLDLRRMRLLTRSRPATPLAELRGRPTFTVPFRQTSIDTLLLEVELNGRRIPAHLDTGLPQLLRLPRSLLAPLGLPTDAASWRARGAIDWPIGGAGGVGGTDLLVQLEQVTIGPVTYLQPYVLIAELGDPRLADRDRLGDDDAARRAASGMTDALVGTGMLLEFAEVGLDPDRQCIELLADVRDLAGVAAGDSAAGLAGALEDAAAGELEDVSAAAGPPPGGHEDDRIVVQAPGPFLGFVLTAPHAVEVREKDEGEADEADDRPHDLPHVHDVLAGTPALAAGLRKGDRLLDINGVSVRGLPPAALFGWGQLWSPPRGGIALRVLRKGVAQPVVIELLR